MEQKEIVLQGNLLNNDGTLKTVGYSKSMLLKYNKGAIRKRSRIKEWDYYYIADQRYGLCLTISNLSYANVISVSVIDFIKAKHFDKTSMKFLSDELELPIFSNEGTSYLKTKDAEFTFEVQNGERHLFGYYKNFYEDAIGNKDLTFDIKLSNEPEESMVKSTPFKNKNHFYYNQKINCMKAEGKFMVQGKEYIFHNMALATLDWGRGVLPYNSKWIWASMQTYIDNDNIVGFNLGSELGDNSDATENMIFFNGKAYKLGHVDIYIPKVENKLNYTGTWTFYSDDGSLELYFEPIVDRYVPFNIGFIKFIPHQVFGRYSGRIKLPNGVSMELTNINGFAERVVNRW